MLNVKNIKISKSTLNDISRYAVLKFINILTLKKVQMDVNFECKFLVNIIKRQKFKSIANNESACRISYPR